MAKKLQAARVGRGAVDRIEDEPRAGADDGRGADDDSSPMNSQPGKRASRRTRELIFDAPIEGGHEAAVGLQAPG